jgi:serine phosphatase RsbU (regulator of sigma subunit)/anti-sigma regulatory factor (Ser/Thr protein kinase)/tetratricopeptide (TPR) repeat protein/transposase
LFQDVVKEQLKIPAHIDHLGELRDFVTRIGKKHDFSDKVINAFKLAIDEAGTNVIRHAYRGSDTQGFITIRALIKKSSMTICLIDQGKFFDPKHVKDPDLQRYVDIGKKGGLGIFIMRKLMDEIDYRRTEEGNELRLTKHRDAPLKKSKMPIRVPRGVPVHMPTAFKGIPATLKARYWIRTSAVITVIVGLGYLLFFFRAASENQGEVFATLTEVGKVIKNNLISDPDILLDDSGAKIQGVLDAGFKDRRGFLYDIIVVDSTDFISAHTDINRGYRRFDEMPANRKMVAPDIYLYRVMAPSDNDQPAEREVYDHFTPIITRDGAKYGYLHVRIFKDYVDGRIAARRTAEGTLALTILLVSYIGAMLLVYILMNPFRRLADWVRMMGHGGEVGDEMDIDTSTEVGEIAQAFSDITVKFRESQKNLAEQERLQKEMQVAQEIQQTLLPSSFPDLEGYELASYYEAAKEVGGDYYDFVEVDKDTLGVVVADVSGKGVPGSLVMAMIRQALRAEARNLYDAAEVLSRVNESVMGDMKKGMFVTIFYVIIDSKRRRLNYASAGHNPMILYRPLTKKTYYLNPRGFPIGIQLHEKDLFRKSIESDVVQLAEDDILLMYTDGITEAMNGNRDLFGEERLLQCIREYGGLRVTPFVDKLKEEIFSFTEGNIQYDDITAVAIREKTSPEKEELRRAKEAHRLITEGQSIREACETVGITTYTYYNKYKKEFEENGIDSVSVDAGESVDVKHIAIEDKTKIFDIIRNHAEYGAKRLSEELNTEKYGFTQISENTIYDELLRSRLNTRQLREAFVARGGRQRRPMKPPGTPMLTLDGKIIIDRKGFELPPPKEIEIPPPPRPELPLLPEPEVRRALPAPRRQPRVDLNAAEVDANTLTTPIEDLLDRNRDELGASPPFVESPVSTDASSGSPDEEGVASERHDDASIIADASEVAGITFEELFTGGTIVDPHSDAPYETAPVRGGEAGDAMELATSSPATGEQDEEEKADADLAFSAVDDLLRQELENSFMSDATSTTLTDNGRIESEAETLEQEPSSFAEPELDRAGSLHVDDFAETVSSAGHEITGGFVDRENTRSGEAVPVGQNDFAGDAANHEGIPSSALPEIHQSVDAEESAFAPSTADDEEAAQQRFELRERLLINGLRHYKGQRFQEAIEEFKKAIALFPDFKEAHSILGNAYFRNHMYTEAARAYDRVKEIDPSDTTAYENMGVIHANRGEFHEAVREWEEVLKIDPLRDDIRKKIDKATRMMHNASF